ncbi:hypothetical protein, conserved [Angomonas deanei]|uniref:Uncharacterized protein n=1 Tax=Angomonas deanei TaxID=59799 RepID=A0A7G2CM39_9TRYP|nr:hypothetical protein, conserved [Angomonas deanei]
MEEVLDLLRNDIPSRPNFNLLFRLMDYYFATDNVEKLIAVMEDAHEYGVTVAESSTAKLMQLACAFNYPTAPELFLRWRVSLPQCAIASPDISRLLFYYSRSGGGLPCPACGEKYNHRNVNVYHWMATPPHQRQCPVLHMARNRKGDLEADPALPQNRDWSERALQLRELSTARSIEWGTQEWRGFLGCFMFAPTEKAMQAKALLDQSMGAAQMDDFLRAAYIRLLRYHAPELSLPVLRQWEDSGIRMSPIVLQEALMAAVTLDDSVQRLESLTHTWDLLREKGSYVMPFTRRYVERRRDALQQQAPLSGEESHIIREVVEMRPRTVSLLDRKDSSSDFVIGTSKKNIYIPKRSLKESERRRDQRRQRSQSE